MFPTQSKASRPRISPLWLLPAVALALLLVGYVVFNATPAGAQTPSGDFCVEGIVIDWEEEPLAGWAITLTGEVVFTTTPQSVVLTTTSAAEPDEDEDDPEFEEGEFAFKENDPNFPGPGDGVPQFPGFYTATIESRVGWEGVTPTTLTFPINAGNDDCVKIRFKMRRIIPVTVYKIDANHDPLEDWTIKVVPGPGNLFATADEEETNISGTAFFTLTPGNWVLLEMPPEPDRDEPRESYMPVVPPSGRMEIDLDEDDIAPGEGITVVFKNELVGGCIAVVKESIPAPVTEPVSPAVGAAFTGAEIDPTEGFFNIAGWTFTLKRKDGSIARQGVTDAFGRLEFDNLPLGPYVLVEENRAGWAEALPGVRTLDVVVDGDYCDNLNPDGDPEDEAIYFDNFQDNSGFCVEGYKVDANGGYGIPGWKIETKPLDDGGYDPGDVFTDGLGKYVIEFPGDDYRIPGGKFEVCEDEVDGWLPHTDTCQTVVLPEWPTGECIQLNDFVNQQVGHSESEKGKDGPYGHGPRGDGRYDGPSMGDHSMSCSSTYEVKPGEGLFDIARSLKVSPQAMLDANPDVAKNKNQWVYVGQRICIP
jgi:hypothetical protein